MKQHRQQIEYAIDLGFAGEVDCQIEYEYHKGRAGSWYDRNGDPGDPPEGPYVAVHKVIADGCDITDLVCQQLDYDEDFLFACAEDQE